MPDYIHKNYYEILDVSCDADGEALKRAYRRMVKRYHPDKQPENDQAEELFKELQEAYEVLKDPERRDQYDVLYLRQMASSNHGDVRSAKKRRGGKNSGVSGLAEDMFDFVKKRMGNQGKRGEDLRYVLNPVFEEAACGTKKVIYIPKWKTCPSCVGRGWDLPGQKKSPVCQGCRGEGEITVFRGQEKTVKTCPACDGKGLHEKSPCIRCKGEGKIAFRVRRTVTIPPGVDNGTRLKIRGEGGVGEKDGEKGDLYIVIQVKDHPVFKRHNLDVWTNLSLHFTQAALGDEVTVETIRGETPLKIPRGTQSGEVLILKGFGIPGLNGSHHGDHQVRVQVEVPKKFSKEEKELLETWAKMKKH